MWSWEEKKRKFQKIYCTAILVFSRVSLFPSSKCNLTWTITISWVCQKAPAPVACKMSIPPCLLRRTIVHPTMVPKRTERSRYMHSNMSSSALTHDVCTIMQPTFLTHKKTTRTALRVNLTLEVKKEERSREKSRTWAQVTRNRGSEERWGPSMVKGLIQFHWFSSTEFCWQTHLATDDRFQPLSRAWLTGQ